MGWERNKNKNDLRRVGVDVDVDVDVERKGWVGLEKNNERKWWDKQGSQVIHGRGGGGAGKRVPSHDYSAIKEVKDEIKVKVEEKMRTFLVSCWAWSWHWCCRRGCDRGISGGGGSDGGRGRCNRVSRHTFHSLLYVSCSWQYAFRGDSTIHTQSPQGPQ